MTGTYSKLDRFMTYHRNRASTDDFIAGCEGLLERLRDAHEVSQAFGFRASEKQLTTAMGKVQKRLETALKSREFANGDHPSPDNPFNSGFGNGVAS